MTLPPNLFANLPSSSPEELFATLLERPGLRIERIASYGQSSPEGFWYDQPQDEWVLLLAGAARLWLAGRGEIALTAGDALLIPAHVRHRVTWTQAEPATVWLAVHMETR